MYGYVYITTNLINNKRYIYGGYLYFFTSTRDTATNKYPLNRVNLSTMTLETVGYISSYSSAYFVLYNKIPHIVLNNYLYRHYHLHLYKT